jgi:hypothetical protein
VSADTVPREVLVGYPTVPMKFLKKWQDASPPLSGFLELSPRSKHYRSRLCLQKYRLRPKHKHSKVSSLRKTPPPPSRAEPTSFFEYCSTAYSYPTAFTRDCDLRDCYAEARFVDIALPFNGGTDGAKRAAYLWLCLGNNSGDELLPIGKGHVLAFIMSPLGGIVCLLLLRICV